MLGPIVDRTIVELGCGTGDNAAALAAAGAYVTGVDISPDVIQQARPKWRHQPRLRLIHADAAGYLADNDEQVDIIYSIYGALTFNPADELLALITDRLRPAGQLATAHRLPRSPGQAQAHDAPGLYTYTQQQWTQGLHRHGLHPLRFVEVPAPANTMAGCHITTAVTLV